MGAIATENAALIFSRWSQENFFAYMTKHYALDLLSEYGTEEFPGTQQVVNPKHIDWHDMKDDDKFERLRPSRKQLTDTIKMIAYRAETALVNTVREKLSRKDDARSLIRDLCNSEADILPDIKGGILNI